MGYLTDEECDEIREENRKKEIALLDVWQKMRWDELAKNQILKENQKLKENVNILENQYIQDKQKLESIETCLDMNFTTGWHMKNAIRAILVSD